MRCIDCGCLSARDSKTKELVEAEQLLRNEWETIHNGEKIYQKIPVCCMQLRNFDALLGNQLDDSVRRDDVLKLIGTDIGQCSGFQAYDPGTSPKKILAMIEQLASQRFQDEQREKERRWQAEQSAIANKRQDERDERQREWQEKRDQRDREEKQLDRKNQRLNAIIAAIVALVISLIGIAVSWFLHPGGK